jgi:hypothetical protein
MFHRELILELCASWGVWNGAATDNNVWCFQPFEENQIKLQNDQSIIRHTKRVMSSNGSDESGNRTGVTHTI